MFGLGLPELLVILVIALLVFGAGRLPEIGSSLGKAIKGFKDASDKRDPEPAEPKGTGFRRCNEGVPAVRPSRHPRCRRSVQAVERNSRRVPEPEPVEK